MYFTSFFFWQEASQSVWHCIFIVISFILSYSKVRVNNIPGVVLRKPQINHMCWDDREHTWFRSAYDDDDAKLERSVVLWEESGQYAEVRVKGIVLNQELTSFKLSVHIVCLCALSECVFIYFGGGIIEKKQ